MTQLLIDADVLVYWAAFGAQKTRYSLEMEDGTSLPFEDAASCKAYIKEHKLEPEQFVRTSRLDVLAPKQAISCAENVLTQVLEAIDYDRYTLCLSGEGNFRKDVATLAEYKGNRVQEKPVHYELVKDFFFNHSNVNVSENEEADDVLGWMSVEKPGSVVASVDKDLRQLHGKHYEWSKDIRYKVNPEQADRWFWLQMLMGDSADNIPGIKGCGPKGAEKLLEKAGERRLDRYDAVAEKYQAQYGDTWEAAMQEVGTLLWIRRERGQRFNVDDYINYKLKEA